jgi:hypothetical protein
VLHVDDLIQARQQQVGLTVVSRLGHLVPRIAMSGEGIESISSTIRSVKRQRNLIFSRRLLSRQPTEGRAFNNRHRYIDFQSRRVVTKFQSEEKNGKQVKSCSVCEGHWRSERSDE